MPLQFLLDTSVYSQPIRPRPLVACRERWERNGDELLAVPAIAIAELEYGLFLKDSDNLWTRYRCILKDRLAVLDFNPSVATTFARLKARQRQSGKSVDDFDLAIAATAVTHQLKLATLNRRHFELIDELEWEDWSV
jgi:tRNA(fMet)-specific endonuclease VapC